MPNNSPKSAWRARKSPPQQEQSSSRRFAEPAIQAITLLAVVAYLRVFFRQPSVSGLVDQNNQVVDRLVDLLVLPSVAVAALAQFSTVVLLDRAGVLLISAGWLAAATCIGWPVTVLLRDSLTQLERISLACLGGLSLLSTAVLLVGLGGGLSSRGPLLGALAALLIASGIATLRLKKIMATIKNNETNESPHAHVRDRETNADTPTTWPSLWMQRLVPVGTGLLGSLYLLGSVLPAWEFDVLEYHLQAPKEFLQLGRIDFLPHNIYANMPLGIEMHSLATMLIVGGDQGWWWGGLSGKVVSGCITVFAALLLGGFVSRHLGKSSGWLAAGLLLSMPGLLHVSWSGLIDGALAAYVLAVFVTVHLLLCRPKPGSKHAAWLLLGILAGGAAATKYTGVVFAILPCITLFVVLCWRHRQFQWAGGGLLTAGLLLTCVPWYAKNAVLTGNPVYPLAYEVFGARSLEPERAARWQAAHRPGGNAVAERAFSVQEFWRAAQAPLWASPFVNPGLVFLAGCGSLVAIRLASRQVVAKRPPVPLATESSPTKSVTHMASAGNLLAMRLALGGVLWIMAVWWFATHRIDRFWLPTVPLLCYLAALGSQALGRQRMDWLATGFVLLAIAYGGVNALSGASPVDNRLFEPLEALRSEAADPQRAIAISPTLAWLNQRYGNSDEVLLLIGEARPYPLTMPIRYATCFDAPAGKSLLSLPSLAEQHQALESAGIGTIVVNWTEISRYRSPGNYGFDDWPNQATTEQWVASNLVERVVTPFPASALEVFRVVSTPRN